MKALVLKGIDLPIEYIEAETPQPKAGEVRIQIAAAALNHRDVWIQKGRYAGLKFPIIPGSDGAGIVEAIGEGVDANWLGKRILINPSQEWGNDPKAQSKQFKILGLPENGTFAQFVCVPVGTIHETPAHLSDAEAAALPLAGLTAFRALVTQGGLQAGEKVLITGIGGGVAQFAAQLARAKGAQVWVTSGSEDKLAFAIQHLGVQNGVNYHTPTWAADVSAQSGGIDLVIDGAGGAGFVKLLDLLSPGGRIVNYGATQGNIPDLPLSKIFWKQLTIKGSTMGSPQDFIEMLTLVKASNLKPIVDSQMSMKEGEAAFRRMDSGAQNGKIVLLPE